MSDVNPYASPVVLETTATERSRVRGVGALVVMNFVLNALAMYRNWPELKWMDHVVGAAIWFALPLVALYLVWRRRSAGRWILAGLFGLRAAGSFLILFDFLFRGRPWMHMLVIVQAFAYGAATVWLLFSRTMRRQPEVAGGSNG